MKKMLTNTYKIEKGTMNDVDELSNLYDELNDYLQSGTNYPGWIKGVYPTRETAINGMDNNLFVLRIDEKIAGSIILSHNPEAAYKEITWGIDTDYKNIIVIHTFAIHPNYMNKGIGKILMDFAKSYSKNEKMKAIRLDVSINNLPAISLYEKCGYKYMGTVDLGLNIPDLVWFKLYEILL